MSRFEIDHSGYVIGVSGLPLEKGNRQIEMSANQTLALLPEQRDKGFATRIVTMDGEVRLVPKTPRALLAEMVFGACCSAVTMLVFSMTVPPYACTRSASRRRISKSLSSSV